MCHLLLLLPVIALPVFWIWPLSIAGPAYAVASVMSIAVYVLASKAMRRPVLTGREHLVGAKGRVVKTSGGHTVVAINAELWSAATDSQLEVGDEVCVIDAEGLKLRVEPVIED